MSLLMEALKRAERDKHKADADESAAEESSAGQVVETDWPLTTDPLQDESAFPPLEWAEPTSGDSAPAAASLASHPLPPPPSPARGEGAEEKDAGFDLLPHEPAPIAATVIPPLTETEPTLSPPADATRLKSTIPALQPPARQEEPEPAQSPPLRMEPTLQSAAPSATKLSSTQETTTAQRQQLAAKVLAATQKTPGRNRLLLVAVGTMAILLLTGSAYLYWQYPQYSSAQNSGGPRPTLAAPPVAATIAPVEPSPLPAPQIPPPPMLTAAETTARDPAPAAPRQAPPPHVAPLAEQAPRESAITIRRSTRKDQVAPALERGYSAFMAGNDSLAQQEYASILRQDNNNRDALLGMAAIAAKHGHWDQAVRTYLRLQELDPRDAAAQAGLLSLTAGQADPVQSESRVKTLLAQQPEAHFLHFALGNLYAVQSRWAEAQQAFFHAFQKAPDNPDYLYNLAISLDHLNQGKLALEYYQRALSRPGPANFDKVAARNRAMELQQPTEN